MPSPKASRTKPAASAPVAKKAPARKVEVSDEDADEVDAYMKRVKHPLKAEIEAVRVILRDANKKVSERIKWNAPSYHYKVDMASFNLHTTNFVQLIFVFPHGIIDDTTGLLRGTWEDRREARFHDMADVRAKAASLKRVVNAWVKLVDDQIPA
jgi:hypothetical protein